MSWISDALYKIFGEDTKDFTAFANLPSAAEWAGRDIKLDESYVELYVESMRLKKARRFGSTFHGAVYVAVSLARGPYPAAKLAAISKPLGNIDLDQTYLDRVIQVSKQLVGATPWRGGVMGLELGLVSIKSGNLLTPVLNFVSRLSETAGVSFVDKAAPFVPLISEGMSLLSGQSSDTELEVGYDSSLSLTKSGLYAVVAVPKDTFKGRRLTLDPNDSKLLVDGEELKEAYCVFSIRQSLQKADYGEIPDLKDKYTAIDTAIRQNKQKQANDALTAFRLAAIASPDLITSDALTLIKKATHKVALAFPAGGVSAALTSLGIGSLADIDLYS